jgi:hypothetical protein
MQKEIEKVADIVHPSLDILKEYFENLNNDWSTSPISPINNFTIYKKENSINHQKETIVNLNKTIFSQIFPKEIIDNLYEFVDYLKSIYNIEIIWFMLYQPKTHLSFHIDTYSNRHLISFFENERFFTYESTDSVDFDLYTNKMKENINSLDVFNQFYLERSPEHNKIRTLKSNEVYTFGYSMHNFFNDSDKLRACFVFEIDEVKSSNT